jgi:metal-responsive CopG/Arc/MetJ family transcriptional regulator
MKTAVSLPERIFREAEKFARRLRKSRSRLYAEAIAEYLSRHGSNDITESMNAVCDRLAKTDDTFPRQAARQVISREAW